MTPMKTLLTLALLCCATAHAALQLTLTPSLHSSARGAEIVFKGTLTNTSTTSRLFVNDLTFALTGGAATQLTPNTNAFFANVPGILSEGESYTTGELFRLAVAAGAPFGDYAGSVSIVGGSDITATTTLATTAFTVRVPNPATDTADDDHDGVPNLLEYALDLNSQSPGDTASTAASISTSYLTFQFTPNSAATDASLIVEGSPDMVNWSAADAEDVTPLAALATGTRTYRYRQPAGTTTRGFLRLRVVR